MERTFEERIGQEIDSLYAGALFLHGGLASRAERLLLEALRQAFRAYGKESESARNDFTTWLEGWLVRTFVASLEPVEDVAPAPEPGGPAEISDVDAVQLNRAARSVPGWARAALWLIIVRRWRYDAACRVLGIDRQRLRGLLAFRRYLLDAVAGSQGGGIASKVRDARSRF